jgi:hypothetical protein
MSRILTGPRPVTPPPGVTACRCLRPGGGSAVEQLFRKSPALCAGYPEWGPSRISAIRFEGDAPLGSPLRPVGSEPTLHTRCRLTNDSDRPQRSVDLTTGVQLHAEPTNAEGPRHAARRPARSSSQRGAILRRPKLAPSGSLTIAKRPPGNSWGESISCAPRSSAVRNAASTSSTIK